MVILQAAIGSCHDRIAPDQSAIVDQCPFSKQEIDYDSRGRDFMLGDLPMYETFDTSRNMLLIGIHEIFGVSRNTHYIADRMAERYPFIIVTPDFYRGQPWDAALWPPTV